MTPRHDIFDEHLARSIVLDELFDLTLYRRFSRLSTGKTKRLFEELIPVEEGHLSFWRDFFQIREEELDALRRIKLFFLSLAGRILGEKAMHLMLEAIEIHGVRKYLFVAEAYRGRKLGKAVEKILEEELRHEDAAVSSLTEYNISPERIRNIFLGLNDGLVEMVGAVSGFFAVFSEPSSVFPAGLMVAVAGSFSMAGGVYVAVSSEREVGETEAAKNRFLGRRAASASKESAFASAVFVGISYFAGAMVPLLPIFFSGSIFLMSAISAGLAIILVSWILAFLSGMDVRRRISMNVAILALAVAITYGIGLLAQSFLGAAI
jgi:VIT1/CCC1 family predicted Fe2+/Mn2+ transporter